MLTVAELPVTPQPINIEPYESIASFAEWSILAIISLFLIKQLVEANKLKRESDRELINKLVDELCDDKRN